MPARSAAARATSRSAASAAPARGRNARRPAPRPRAVPFRGPLSRLRWDRLARIAMLGTLLIVGFLYAQHILSYLSTRSQAEAEHAVVHQLAAENAALRAEQRALLRPVTIEQQARKLGMVRAGERSYAITGLPAGN